MARTKREKWLADHAANRAKVVRLYAQLRTMEAVGLRMGISRERVRQILEKERIDSGQTA